MQIIRTIVSMGLDTDWKFCQLFRCEFKNEKKTLEKNTKIVDTFFYSTSIYFLIRPKYVFLRTTIAGDNWRQSKYEKKKNESWKWSIRDGYVFSRKSALRYVHFAYARVRIFKLTIIIFDKLHWFELDGTVLQEKFRIREICELYRASRYK